jgi:hypothetical protein
VSVDEARSALDAARTTTTAEQFQQLVAIITQCEASIAQAEALERCATILETFHETVAPRAIPAIRVLLV